MKSKNRARKKLKGGRPLTKVEYLIYRQKNIVQEVERLGKMLMKINEDLDIMHRHINNRGVNEVVGEENRIRMLNETEAYEIEKEDIEFAIEQFVREYNDLEREIQLIPI